MIKNVANNVVQGKVQDLTERYKRGKLEDGYYYVKIVGDKFYMLEWKDKHWYEFGWDCWFFEEDVVEVLEEIPDFIEWVQLQNWADFTNDYHELREKLEIAEYKNAELKELLKECRKYFDGRMHDFIIRSMLTKIDEVLK